MSLHCLGSLQYFFFPAILTGCFTFEDFVASSASSSSCRELLSCIGIRLNSIDLAALSMILEDDLSSIMSTRLFSGGFSPCGSFLCG